MFNFLLRFFLYLGEFVQDSKTGKPSVKRYGLALAITVLCGVMLGVGLVISVVTLNAPVQSYIELVRILSSTLEVLAGLVLTATTTGYLVDKAQQNKVSKSDDNS